MAKYRKKPVMVEAWQWNGEKPPKWPLYLQNQPVAEIRDGYKIVELRIATLEGDLRTSRGDWIIKGVKGEIYPCKPDIFAATYEPVDE